MTRLAAPLLALAVLVLACDGAGSTAAPDDAHPHPEHGPRGGALVELGTGAAHLEFFHDEVAGTVTVHVLGKDGATAVTPDVAPVLRIQTASGGRTLELAPLEGGGPESFTVTDAALAGHVSGRITVEVGGKTYNPDLPHDHDH